MKELKSEGGGGFVIVAGDEKEKKKKEKRKEKSDRAEFSLFVIKHDDACSSSAEEAKLKHNIT